MELKDRIATVIKVNQHTASSFAELLNVQRSSISHILKGRNKPSIDFLEKVLLHFPRVDARWLITGQNPGKNSASPVTEMSRPEKATAANPVETKDAAQLAGDVERIVIFKSDGTFETYIPGS